MNEDGITTRESGHSMRSRLRLLCVCLLTVCAWGTEVMAYENVYERTPVGMVEIKELPTRIALASTSSKSYFDEDNGLFMRLFRYIDKHDISMTVPVEADIEPGSMRFFVGSEHEGTAPPDDEGVSVQELPTQTVVSYGIRGGYNREHYEEGLAALRTWLTHNEEWSAIGSPYMVYWHGPFMPGWFKRSEVHIPVAPKR